MNNDATAAVWVAMRYGAPRRACSSTGTVLATFAGVRMKFVSIAVTAKAGSNGVSKTPR